MFNVRIIEYHDIACLAVGEENLQGYEPYIFLYGISILSGNTRYFLHDHVLEQIFFTPFSVIEALGAYQGYEAFRIRRPQIFRQGNQCLY